MVVPEPLRWLLTLALTGSTAFHLGRALRPAGVEGRIAESLHAVMGLAMVAMLWPFGRAVPASAWLVVFAGAAGWFAAQASRAGKRRIVPAYFATTAAAMVWMSGTMPAGPAMDMPGMEHASGGGRAAWAGAVIGCYLVVAGLGWLLSGLRLGPSVKPAPCHWPAVCHGVMSVSMGLAMLALV
jgi:uncharacterized protein DUF5134